MAKKQKETKKVESMDEVLRKYAGMGARPGNAKELETRWVSTGITSMDKVLGGGIPLNRLTILLGDYSAGKTFLCQKIIESFQSKGLKCAYIDAEMKMDPEWFGITGIDTSQLLVYQNSVGEEVLNLCTDLVADVDLIIVDSLAALVPLAESESDMKQDLVAAQARMINKFFRKVLPKLNQRTGSTCAVIFINQVRSGIGGFIPIESYPGGRAQKFFASIIIRVSRSGFATAPAVFKGKQIKKRIGFDINVKTEKNSLSTAFRFCAVPFSFDGTVDLVRALGRAALDEGIIEQEGVMYTYGDLKARGKGEFLKQLRERQDLQDKMSEELLNYEEFSTDITDSEGVSEVVDDEDEE